MIRRTSTMIRVAVMVAGDYRQKYFPLDGSRAERARVLRQARALEQRWLRDQANAAQVRQHRAAPTARARWPHRTGVRGITLQMAKHRRRNKWQGPRFEITGAGVTTSVAILNRGIGEAWRLAVRILADARGIRDHSHWLRRQPQRAQLRALSRKARCTTKG